MKIRNTSGQGRRPLIRNRTPAIPYRGGPSTLLSRPARWDHLLGVKRVWETSGSPAGAAVLGLPGGRGCGLSAIPGSQADPIPESILETMSLFAHMITESVAY